jgi:prepilin peptidase CpaA
MSIIAVYLIFSMLAVMWLDATRYTIPNWLVGSLLLAYPFAVFTSPFAVDWQMALAGAALVLVLGYIVFTLRWMGGGDVKLLAALALWVGVKCLADFIFITALLGGVLSLFLWGFRKILPYIPGKPKKEKLPRILQDNAPVPYGIAIALAFLFLLWTGKIPLVS